MKKMMASALFAATFFLSAAHSPLMQSVARKAPQDRVQHLLEDTHYFKTVERYFQLSDSTVRVAGDRVIICGVAAQNQEDIDTLKRVTTLVSFAKGAMKDRLHDAVQLMYEVTNKRMETQAFHVTTACVDHESVVIGKIHQRCAYEPTITHTNIPIDNNESISVAIKNFGDVPPLSSVITRLLQKNAYQDAYDFLKPAEKGLTIIYGGIMHINIPVCLQLLQAQPKQRQRSNSCVSSSI